LTEQYGMTAGQMRETVAETRLYPDMECDEQGMLTSCTVEQWFDELDKELIAHFGEEFRTMVNESRTEWNKKGDWKFNML
jgi:hypothetical protein